MNKKIRNDVILLVSVVLVALGMLLTVHLTRKNGSYVAVLQGGKEVSRYSLLENNRIEIRSSENKEHLNILVVENGRAFIEDASCPDKICVKHRKISKVGESIVCLPNRVVLRIVSDAGGDVDITI
jgi:hypothetical protein